jgi:HK97 gp10 family phage protein
VPYQSRIPEIIAALDPAMLKAAHDGAELIAQAAKERVPVVTGRLQRAIHVEKIEDGAAVIAGDKEAFYGNMVEHGGAINRPPRPFLIPALEEKRDEVEREIAQAIRRVTQ